MVISGCVCCMGKVVPQTITSLVVTVTIEFLMYITQLKRVLHTVDNVIK